MKNPKGEKHYKMWAFVKNVVQVHKNKPKFNQILKAVLNNLGVVAKRKKMK